MSNIKEKKCSVCQKSEATENCSTMGGLVYTCNTSRCKELAFIHGKIFVANQEKEKTKQR